MAAERPTSPAANPDKRQVGQAGEHFVAAELHRRGANAVTFAGNMPGIDILASNVARTRTVSIQVKTRRTGSWHTTTRFGRPRQEEPGETEYWVFVHIGLNPEPRRDFFIVPAWWMQNSIHVEHAAYLAKHGGRRAKNPDSEHHAIYLSQIEEWRESWDQLGIF